MPPPTPFLGPRSLVIAYLKEPRERYWGIVRSLDATGVVLQGVDLNAFDDWLRQLGREGDEAVGLSTLFFPLLRVEKLMVDAPSGSIPSLGEQVERRIGRPLLAYLDEL